MTKLKILNGQILQYYNYQAQAQVQVLGPELYNKFGFHQVSWTSDGLVRPKYGQNRLGLYSGLQVGHQVGLQGELQGRHQGVLQGV